ncbi:MAG: thiaminase II, partial [Thaumarchaeota archaeon]
VEELKAFTDDMASEINYERLEKIFLMASRYEYMFWDMAYNLEKWPI